MNVLLTVRLCTIMDQNRQENRPQSIGVFLQVVMEEKTAENYEASLTDGHVQAGIPFIPGCHFLTTRSSAAIVNVALSLGCHFEGYSLTDLQKA